MDLQPLQIAIVGIAILISTTVQASVGFAAALVSLPLLLAAGVNLPVSIAVLLICSSLSNITGVLKLRREIEFEVLKIPALLRLLNLPIGFIAMQFLNDRVAPNHLKQLVGLVVLIVLIIQWSAKIKPREKVSAIWKYVAFSLSGLMQGSIGMPGPPMALWVMAHDWPAKKSRVFMFSQSVIGLPPHMVLLVLYSSESLLNALILSVASLPSVILGTISGLWLGKRMNRHRLRRLILLLLLGVAANAIIGTWLWG